jgi:5-deoxy-glucuronate isomerase
MYYLNVMAGPGEGRALAFCDDPAHAWIRDSWAGTELDPRCPVTSSSGRTDDLAPAYDDDPDTEEAS